MSSWNSAEVIEFDIWDIILTTVVNYLIIIDRMAKFTRLSQSMEDLQEKFYVIKMDNSFANIIKKWQIISVSGQMRR